MSVTCFFVVQIFPKKACVNLLYGINCLHHLGELITSQL